MSNSSSGRTISPKQLVQSWSTLPNKFEVNVLNFETTIGKEGVSAFRESFYLGRFNSSGEFSWKERRDKKPHPILNKTGQLKNSIVWKRLPLGSKNSRGINIYTNPRLFRSTSSRHPGFCYAAIHNAENGTYSYGKSGVPSIQRQFIGHSTVLADKINKNSHIIFDGFPK